MNTFIKCLLAGMVAVSMSGCHGKSGHDALEHSHNHNHAEKSDAHDEEGNDEIVLSPAIAERMGVSTETAAPGKFHEVIKVSGTIMESPDGGSVVTAPTAGVVTLSPGISVGSNVGRGATIARVNPSAVSGGNPNLAAKASLDAAKRELDRLTPLYKEKIVTASEYNSAVRAYEEAKASYSGAAASGRAVAVTGGVITALNVTQGQYVDAGAPIATISGGKSLVLQADLPERYYGSVASVSDARVKLPYVADVVTVSESGGSKMATPAALTATKPGYVPVYFSLTNDGKLIPGSGVEVYLLGNALNDVVTVPIDALSEQQGNLFVYERLDEECYRKVPVTIGASDGQRVVVASGLKGGEQIVAKGTTSVRLAESSGVVPEGHSHNH